MTSTATENSTSPQDVDLLQIEHEERIEREEYVGKSIDLGRDGLDDDEANSSSRLLGDSDEPESPKSVPKVLVVEEENEAPSTAISAVRTEKEPPVTWRSLPRKGQLAILTFARLSEPFTQTSLTAYLFYQLKSFDSTLPDSTITAQGGMVQAAFPAAQLLTAVLWGRAADTDWIGRKRVLLIGLFGTCFACLGFGFSKSFTQAMVYRVLGGALNGNIGVMRTMISEIIKEKKYQSRAFLLLPMCYNIGVIIGPITGGFMADPVDTFPRIFGPNTALGGKDGVAWMRYWPYALPNLFSATFIFIAGIAVILGLDETHPTMRYKPDLGRRIGTWLVNVVYHWRSSRRYSRLAEADDTYTASIDLETQPRTPSHSYSSSNPLHHYHSPASTQPSHSEKFKLPFAQIWTRNVLWTIAAHFFLALHISAFNSVFLLLLPVPRNDNAHAKLPFRFTGGLGLPSAKVGLATAIIGVIGLPLQLLYPRFNTQLGTLKLYRLSLPFSPMAYTAIPFLALLPDKPYFIWPALVAVLSLQIVARTFTLPSAIILINNSTPHPSVLGTLHGVAQSVSSAARTLGPVVGGWGLGEGLRHNVVGAVWWAMALVACTNWGMTWLMQDG